MQAGGNKQSQTSFGCYCLDTLIILTYIFLKKKARQTEVDTIKCF